MKYETYLKNKDFAMNYVVPAFRESANVSKIIANRLKRYGNSIAYCGTNKIIQICNDCGTSYFDGFYSCKNRFCPVCQKRKSLLLYSKLFPLVEEYLRNGYYINVMTITIKDTKDLEDGLYLLRKAFRKAFYDNKKNRQIFENIFIGGIKSLEVKKGENSKEWHPHFHCLVIKKKPTRDFEFLNIEFNKAVVELVNEYNKVIYEDKYYSSGYKLIKNEQKSELILDDKLSFIWIKSLNECNFEEKVKTVYECIKYITKYDVDLTNDLEELVINLKDIRAVDSWGILRGIETASEKQEDTSMSEIKERICAVCGSKAFEILDGISLEEVKELGYSTDLKDFKTRENMYDKN